HESMELMLSPDDVLIGVGHLCTGSNGLAQTCYGNFAACGDAAGSIVDQMSLVKHWGDFRAVNDGNEVSAQQIELIRELTDGCIQRQLVVISAEVEEDFALTISFGIHRDSKAGSPVISKRIVLSVHVTGEQLLLPANA